MKAGAAALAGTLCLPLLCGRLLAADLVSAGTLDLRWDNTFRYSTGFRLAPRDAALVANPNSDDGDRDFDPGLVSSRLDIVSQLDLTADNVGVRISAAGWYDSVYTERDDNDSPATFNPLSVPHDKFTAAVRDLHGSRVELSDAFVHGDFTLGDMPISVRAGRYALILGESLFFPQNGIAAGQSTVDDIKAIGEPQAETPEIVLPVTQASVVLFPAPDVAVTLYNQFEWRKDRLPGVGSYFSAVDFLDTGGERLFLGGGLFLVRAPDLHPPSLGQFGAAVQVTASDFSYGFYTLRYDAKSPQVYLHPNPSVLAGNAGTYDLVYPQGIEIYGASFSTYLGDSNVAGEISGRRNMPLMSGALVVPAGTVADGSDHPLYALGDTLHAQISTVSLLHASHWWNGAALTFELAANDRLDVTKNPSALAPGRDPFAMAMQATFEPQYFQVLPSLDISIPIAFGYNLVGRSSIDGSENSGTGNFGIGVSATYRSVWEAKLALTEFLGAPTRQPFADRGFIALSIQRTF
jgi:hypothetical protein